MRPCVYMMVADAGEGFSFCKIGKTNDLAARVCAVQVGCPIPISDVAYMEGLGGQAERIFHYELREFRTQGEWFKLNFSDPIHKVKFAKATERVMKWFGTSGMKWKHMDLDSLKMLGKVLRLDKVA